MSSQSNGTKPESNLTIKIIFGKRFFYMAEQITSLNLVDMYWKGYIISSNKKDELVNLHKCSRQYLISSNSIAMKNFTMLVR